MGILDFVVYQHLAFLFVGEEAKRVFDDAQAMLKKIVDKKLFRAIAEIAFFPANGVGDDIHLFKDDDRRNEDPMSVFYGLRQQAEKEPGVDDPYACLSDFVAPLETGIKDYIGCFASSCFGADELAEQ